MGHIELAAPVSHIWYFKGIPSRMGLILDMSPRILEKVLYFASYIVIDPGRTPMTKKQVLSELEYRDMLEKYEDSFQGRHRGRGLPRAFVRDRSRSPFRRNCAPSLPTPAVEKIRIIKRLEVLEAFRLSNNRPEWMVLDVIPREFRRKSADGAVRTAGVRNLRLKRPVPRGSSTATTA
jgi:DNA-directed RNA polymerase subunit beta'